jgi:hypothetical protein
MSATPRPGTQIQFTNNLEFNYSNGSNVKVIVQDPFDEVSNLEHEQKLNELKQTILILKPEYLGVLISDMRDMMRYDKSTDTIDEFTKKTYNPNLS